MKVKVLMAITIILASATVLVPLDVWWVVCWGLGLILYLQPSTFSSLFPVSEQERDQALLEEAQSITEASTLNLEITDFEKAKLVQEAFMKLKEVQTNEK